MSKDRQPEAEGKLSEAIYQRDGYKARLEKLEASRDTAKELAELAVKAHQEEIAKLKASRDATAKAGAVDALEKAIANIEMMENWIGQETHPDNMRVMLDDTKFQVRKALKGEGVK